MSEVEKIRRVLFSVKEGGIIPYILEKATTVSDYVVEFLRTSRDHVSVCCRGVLLFNTMIILFPGKNRGNKMKSAAMTIK